MDTFNLFFVIAIFCFMVVFLLKNGERKYRYQKTKMVDKFIQQHQIKVHKFYSGQYMDLINDRHHRTIWFFVLEQQKLKYKKIPYEDLYYVAYKLDSHIIHTTSRSAQMKREMLGGEGPPPEDIGPLVNKSNVKMVKEIYLTLIIDDRHASTIDLLFVQHPFMADAKHIQDADAKTWFEIFSSIIEDVEKTRA